mmetsp:Transcript_21771/g.32079  ORF Transcript_21771/g.32079 Transcript_21771/m.32079 type:complete len:263 (-) Transcript_21771:429-1217(-)
MSKRSSTNENHERFVSTMTFTSMFGSCDCDECDEGSCQPASGLTIPLQIKAAVEEHKRQRISIPSQERTLIFRKGGISIWELVIPSYSQPITEFCSSHRFTFVTQIPTHRVVKSVGKGIIGSRSEESQRSALDWSVGDAIFYQSNKGRLGWTNESSDEKKANSKDDDVKRGVNDTSTDVVLFSIKATKSYFEDGEGREDSDQQNDDSWTSRLNQLFRKYLSRDTLIDDYEIQRKGKELDSSDAYGLRNIIDEIVLSKSKDTK